MSPVGIVKFLGAWFCIVAAVALLVVGHEPFGVATTLCVLAVAFAMAPTSWSGG